MIELPVLTPKSVIMRHLSAILLIVFLVATPSCKYFKKDNKAKALAIMKAHADSIRVADSLRKIQDQIMNARLDSARKAEADRLAFDAAHKYNIIVGSFITPEYAKAFSDEYKTKGYDPLILKKREANLSLSQLNHSIHSKRQCQG